MYLFPLDVDRAQLANCLPTSLLQNEGNLCTAAMITDSSINNIDVNLHYLTPRARTVTKNYCRGVETVLGTPLPVNIADQFWYVCHPDTFEEHELGYLVFEIFEKPLGNNLVRRHNHTCLVSLMLLGLGIGARARIDIRPGGIQLLDNNIAHFIEKGATRIVVLPDILVQQLAAYDAHLGLLREVWYKKYGTREIHENLFFLLDENETPYAFKPSSLSKLLSSFNSIFDLDFRSLRRTLFTWIYESGEFGPVADHFISHAVNGTQAFIEVSGVQMGNFKKLAKFVDNQLRDQGWRVSPGINHRHDQFLP